MKNAVILIERSNEFDQQRAACKILQKVLLTNESCEEFCDNFLLNPNDQIVIITPEKNVYKTSDIDALEEILSLSAARTTIFWLKNSEKLTPIVANKLLKRIEEPAENIHFLLTTTNHLKILPTILSRCTVRDLEQKYNSINCNEKIEKFTEFLIQDKTSSIGKINQLIDEEDFSPDDVLNILIKIQKDLFDQLINSIQPKNLELVKILDMFTKIYHPTTTKPFLRMVALKFLIEK